MANLLFRRLEWSGIIFPSTILLLFRILISLLGDLICESIWPTFQMAWLSFGRCAWTFARVTHLHCRRSSRAFAILTQFTSMAYNVVIYVASRHWISYFAEFDVKHAWLEIFQDSFLLVQINRLVCKLFHALHIHVIRIVLAKFISGCLRLLLLRYAFYITFTLHFM